MSLVGGGRHQSWWRPGRITSWLTDDDRCYCLGEYTARQGYSYSPTNNLTLGAMPAKGPSISRSTGCGNQPAQRVNMQLEDLQPRCAVRGVHRAHSRFPGHALTPTGVMAIRCKQFHLPDL